MITIALNFKALIEYRKNIQLRVAKDRKKNNLTSEITNIR